MNVGRFLHRFSRGGDGATPVRGAKIRRSECLRSLACQLQLQIYAPHCVMSTCIAEPEEVAAGGPGRRQAARCRTLHLQTYRIWGTISRGGWSKKTRQCPAKVRHAGHCRGEGANGEGEEFLSPQVAAGLRIAYSGSGATFAHSIANVVPMSPFVLNYL